MTRNLIVICQPALTKVADLVYRNGALERQTIKTEPEYEVILAFDDGMSASTFVTCMHSSFFNLIKTAREYFGKEVGAFFGACHESDEVILNAQELCPSLRCRFREFIMNPELSDYGQAFSEDKVATMKPGDQFFLQERSG